jgi:pimeloyl-ACP methyl ester carboxylesterase
MRTVVAPDGIALAVHEHGGDGRPTLLCHATGFHGAVWEPLSADLGDGFERWAVDFRGHGASVVPPDHPLPWDDVAGDVLAVVDDLGLPAGDVLGVGHSMGGAALLLAEQANPGLFAGPWL